MGLLVGLLPHDDTMYALYAVLYLTVVPLASLLGGYRVLGRERSSRRLEILQTSPLSPVSMVGGLYATALDCTGRVAVPLNLGLLTGWLATAPDHRTVLRVCALTLAAMVTWVCLTALALLAALMSYRWQRRKAGLWALIAVAALLFWHLVQTGTEPRSVLDLLDPLCFVGAVMGSPYYVDPILTWWPAAFYLGLTGVGLLLACWQWANLGEGSPGTLRPDPRPRSTYVKPKLLRDPFVADLVNQLRRRWVRYTAQAVLWLAGILLLAEMAGRIDMAALLGVGLLFCRGVGMSSRSRWVRGHPATVQLVTLTVARCKNGLDD
jgi:hypothetical protein